MQGIRELYSKRAPRYNLTSNLYYLMGIRVKAYRIKAVQALNLQPGSRVLDVACGTGLNFGLLEDAVGEEGKIIGLDFTPAMLARARGRDKKQGWKNVALIEGDATRFELAENVDGVLCTFALSTMPAYPEMIKRSAQVLNSGARLVVLDVKATNGLGSYLNPLATYLTKPFGGNRTVLQRKPWEEMGRYLGDVQLREYYFGFIYVASGSKKRKG